MHTITAQEPAAALNSIARYSSQQWCHREITESDAQLPARHEVLSSVRTRNASTKASGASQHAGMQQSFMHLPTAAPMYAST